MHNSDKYVFLCAVLAYCLLIFVWNQKFRLQSSSYELPVPKSQPLVSNTSGTPPLVSNTSGTPPLVSNTSETPCIPTKIIIFWNEFWNKYVYNAYGIDKGPEVFKNCHKKNCVITKDRSKLYNPEYIVSAIVFFGVGIQKNEFKKIQKFKKSKEWVVRKNGGITPKIILFMRVRFFILINFFNFVFCN